MLDVIAPLLRPMIACGRGRLVAAAAGRNSKGRLGGWAERRCCTDAPKPSRSTWANWSREGCRRAPGCIQHSIKLYDSLIWLHTLRWRVQAAKRGLVGAALSRLCDEEVAKEWWNHIHAFKVVLEAQITQRPWLLDQCFSLSLPPARVYDNVCSLDGALHRIWVCWPALCRGTVFELTAERLLHCSPSPWLLAQTRQRAASIMQTIMWRLPRRRSTS